ncbi:uncharacterized protein F5147DRAFT_769617 [Suillus discolor]|uniref:Uncharacterized protein n=1 Tax=Suillus discolor TaxID=1912936 RepID=A0A9P7FFN1_9AGAM|nr:uncharacterized protein F5147DRAFT_769617 [Suillus discolor]KAG2115163.1 hypothetical protein F5147DRAFT_769617 [Suillus discolor]
MARTLPIVGRQPRLTRTLRFTSAFRQFRRASSSVLSMSSACSLTDHIFGGDIVYHSSHTSDRLGALHLKPSTATSVIKGKISKKASTLPPSATSLADKSDDEPDIAAPVHPQPPPS